MIVFALFAANLPFLTQRLFAVVPLRAPKTLALRLVELVTMYFVAGGLGLLLERHAGQIAPQRWEFYAITGTLLVTFACPGFTYRYLFKHRT